MEDVAESLRDSAPAGRDVRAEGHFSLASIGIGSLCIEGAPEMGESGSSRDFPAEHGGEEEEGIEERTGIHKEKRIHTYVHSHTYMTNNTQRYGYTYVHNIYIYIIHIHT